MSATSDRPAGLARLCLGPTRHVVHSRERGHLARMDNGGPAAHCGQDARAPRDTSRQTRLNCKGDGASRSPGACFGLATLGAVLWLLAATASGMDTREARLFDALDRFDAGDRPGGFSGLHRLVGAHPDFRAARLIRASLLETGDLGRTLADLTPRTVASLLEDPTDEAHSRLSYWFDRPPPGHLPDVLIEAVPGRSKVLVADTARSRLYLFDRSDAGWTMQGDWYTSIGRGGTAKRREGDMKTPLGVYFVTMWIADRYLPELYGAGALGLNYPNGWDQRRQRNGFGIWIHGEPRGLRSRPPRWSQGCLVVSNLAIETLVEAIEEQSIPVIIGDRLHWLAPSDHERRRDEWLTRIASLNRASETNGGLGVYGYPVGVGKESTMILVEFHAEREGRNRWWQYWRENRDGAWRIAHEGPASFDDIHLKGLPPRMPLDRLDRYIP